MIEPPTVPRPVRRSEGLGYAVLLAISVTALHHGLAIGSAAHHRGQDDLELTIPYAAALWRAIRAHESPWWLPWIDGGTSAFARFPYLGPFYPAVLTFIGGDPLRALDAVLLAHVAVAAFGVRAWLRALGASQGASLVAGVVFAGSSVWHVATREGYATEAPVWTWLPWALAAIERARAGDALRRGARAALAVGLLTLGGHGTDLYVGALAALTYLSARLWSLREAPGAVRRIVVASVVAAALGAGIGLAFWLPVLRTIDLSALAVDRPAKPGIPHPLVRLLRPGDGWGTKDSLYIGVVTIAFVAAAFRARTRRLAWPLAVVVLVASVLSFGPGTLAWRALTALPGFAAIDQANVFSWPFALFAAALAGLGASVLDPPAAGRARRTIAIGWLLLVVDLLTYSLHGFTGDHPWTRVFDGGRGASLADRSACGPRTDPSQHQPTRTLDLERWSPEASLRLWRNDALRLGCLEDVRASAHLGSPRTRRMLRALGPWPVDWDTFSDDRARAPATIELAETSRATRVLDLLGVAVVRTDVDVLGDAFQRRAGDGPTTSWVRRTPLPRYRLVPRADVVSGEEAAAERVLAPGFDPWTSVVLEDETQDLLGSATNDAVDDAAPPAPVLVERYRPGDIVVRCRARAGELLVVGETWFRGWRAEVDGRPVSLVRANYLHMALAPPPGEHAVHLTYAPPGLELGLGVAGLSALLAVALATWPVRPRRS